MVFVAAYFLAYGSRKKSRLRAGPADSDFRMFSRSAVLDLMSKAMTF